jgi:type IV secretion system protein VirB9
VTAQWSQLSCLLALLGCVVVTVHANDARLRTVPYSADQVFRLHGFAGYQIDLEFEADERFVGMGSGDVEGLAFEAQDNHLFIKPKALNVRTNLTVLTTRRTYHFDYVAGPLRSDTDAKEVVYAVRFQYPKPPPDASQPVAEAALSSATAQRERNLNYWYCGRDVLRPLQAWDDGVHTHLQFNPRSELPALFVRNDDGSESLLNFNIERDEIVIHRIARQFVVRRGNLVGCIVNRGFAGTGRSLSTGTVSPEVERATRSSVVAP